MEYNNPARSRETLTKQLIRASSVDNETQRNVNRAVEKNRSRPEKGREGKSWSLPRPPAAHLFIRLRSNELSPCDTHVTRRFFKTGREQQWS